MAKDEMADNNDSTSKEKTVKILAWPVSNSFPTRAASKSTIRFKSNQTSLSSPTTTCTGTSSSGFVIGWHQIPSTKCGSGSFYDTFIAIGTIPFHKYSNYNKSDKGNNEPKFLPAKSLEFSLKNEYEFIKSKLHSFHDKNHHCCCCCCTCKNMKIKQQKKEIELRKNPIYSSSYYSTKQASLPTSSFLCGGCTRKICLHENRIDIIGFKLVTNKNDEKNTIKTINEYRTALDNIITDTEIIIITIQNGDDHPNWIQHTECHHGNNTTELDDPNRTSQLLLYESTRSIISDKYAPLYWQQDTPADSFFARHLLTLLTHAGTIWQEIIKQQFQFSSLVEINNDKVEVNKTKQSVIPANEEAELYENHFVLAANFMKPFCHFFQQYSMFYNHCTRIIHNQYNDGKFHSVISCSIVAADRILRGNGTVRALASSSTCTKCNRLIPCLQDSHYEVTNRLIKQYNNDIRIILDTSIGLLIGSIIVYLVHRGCGTSSVARLMEHQYIFLSKGLAWLENYPIGFKLNERLTSHVGRWIRILLGIHKSILYHTIKLDSSVPFVQPLIALFCAFICILFGGSGFFAFLFDTYRIVSIHIIFLHFISKKVFSAELYFLTASWRLFRGKKRNILRQRTDTMEYDSMQLLVGTIMFAIALFLFTTILVYQMFFRSFAIATYIVSGLLLYPYQLLQLFPLGECILRLRGYGGFSIQIFIEEIYDKNVPLTVTYLRESVDSVHMIGTRCLALLLEDVFSPWSGFMQLDEDD